MSKKSTVTTTTAKNHPLAEGMTCPGCGGPMKHNGTFAWCANAPGECKAKNRLERYQAK